MSAPSNPLLERDGGAEAVINNADLLGSEIMKLVLYIRSEIEDDNCSLGLVFVTTQSARRLLRLGLHQEEVSSVFTVPEIKTGEMRGLLDTFCPGRVG